MIIIINDITAIVFCRCHGLYIEWMREALLTSIGLKLFVKGSVHRVYARSFTDEHGSETIRKNLIKFMGVL